MSTKDQLAIAIQALRDVADPIGAMRRTLQPGERLNGAAAVAVADDPVFYRRTARKALVALCRR